MNTAPAPAGTEQGTVTELLLAGPAQALSDLLTVPLPAPEAGLPLLWHWIYLLDRPATADLGPDGHPVRNAVVAPPGPGRRRMWAGGRVRSLGALRVGREAIRHSEIAATRVTRGSSGELTFVTVRHTVSQDGSVVIEEEQDLVYRGAGQLPSTPVAARDPRTVPDTSRPDGWEIEVTPPLLFRFSALTYNGHRIHYDRDYARDVEGYPGLVVHGPLQALVMAEATRARGLPTVGVEFAYRLTAPLFDTDGMFVATAPPAGTQAATARESLVDTTVLDRNNGERGPLPCRPTSSTRS